MDRRLKGEMGRRMGVPANEPSMNGSLFFHGQLPTDNSPSPSTVWFVRCGGVNREAPAQAELRPTAPGAVFTFNLWFQVRFR
jgi:hypothetical protein